MEDNCDISSHRQSDGSTKGAADGGAGPVKGQ